MQARVLCPLVGQSGVGVNSGIWHIRLAEGTEAAL